MNLSLVILRLEVANDSPKLIDFEYTSDSYFKHTDDQDCIVQTHDLSLTLKAEEVVAPSNFKSIPSLHQGKREYREIEITTYKQEFSMDSKVAELCTEEDIPPTGPQRTVSECSESSGKNGGKALSIQYFSGNPMVETTKGILHLYKDKYLTPLDVDIPRSEIICMLGVPAKYSCQDLQTYIAPAGGTLEHIKIIRDNVPNQYMVLLKFKDQKGADEFYQEYEGKAYNMLESEFSHLVYVSRIEYTNSSQHGYLPVSGWTELPTCPVCLERMDESVEGILTILCNHSFHNDCLVKWEDTCCPVCRYCQTPEPALDQKCSECESKESLWICLICGHVGCGRYQEQHAYQHYQQTAHTFSMHLENQRVWDYAGDNYVHRLIQSKGDGKLVSLGNSEGVNGEKMDSLVLEYTYLLTNQLESQRRFFEEKIEFIENDAFERLSLMERKLERTMTTCLMMEQKYVTCEKDRKALERKYENVVGKVGNMTKDLRDEKELNSCLRENQVAWQNKVELLEKNNKLIEEKKSFEINELKCEVGDLMKHLEVQSAVGNAEHGIKQDIQGGQVFVEESPTSSKNNGARTRTKNRKK